MNKKLPFIIFISALCLVSANWLIPTKKATGYTQQFSEKANLALRQVGHHLLTLEGDSSSTIFPVKQNGENEFVLQLHRKFPYDTLPYLLSQALDDYSITDKYHVAVRNCETDTLLLGYNFLAFDKGRIPCLGREQWSECNNISVTFEKMEDKKSSNHILYTGIGLAGILILSSFYFLKREKNDKTKIPPPHINSTLKFGNCLLDHKNQKITIDAQVLSLTFRENKLLHFFASHPNQVLEREKILAEVWGDEGVIVGRSLDVFVSRLRKILKADESVKIKNVHGVGYRLEVND